MGNNKKRDVRNGGDDGDEEDDQIKMEKFYSLLRSFRDARDRRRRELHEFEKHETNNKKMKTDASFEWQDFTTEIHYKKPPVVFPKPIPTDTIKEENNNNKCKEQLQEHALDLKLAL